MSNITQELNKIINAVYGREIRQAIHNAIKKTYDDAAQGGDANIEVSMARGNEPTLGDRLNIMQAIDSELASLLEQKIRKGYGTLDDFDEETRRQILDMDPTEINAVLGQGNVQSENVATRAITPPKTNFFDENIDNLFNGEYIKAVYTWDYQNDDKFFLTANGYYNHDGRVIIFPIQPNERYTIKVFDSYDVFRLGIHDDKVEIPEVVASEGVDNRENKFYTKTALVEDLQDNEFTFKNTTKGKYAILYLSTSGEEPGVLIVKEGYKIKNKYLNTEKIAEQVKENIQDRSATVIESPENGYGPRPKVESVAWIGPNEPTEAEPFDEWRETEGFIYFTDFTEYGLDEKPHDWNEKFSTKTEVNKVIESRNYGGNVYWLRPETDNAPFANAFDKINEEYADTEIFMKARYEKFVQGQHLTTLHRGKVNSYGKEVYLIAGMLYASPDSLYFRAALKTEDDDEAIHLARVKLKEGFDPKEQYYQVSRVDGNRFRGKYWQAGEPEPKEWDFDVNIPNGNKMETGFVGVYSYRSTTNYYIYEYGVGTGGMRAPRRRLK